MISYSETPNLTLFKVTGLPHEIDALKEFLRTQMMSGEVKILNGCLPGEMGTLSGLFSREQAKKFEEWLMINGGLPKNGEER